MTSRLKKFVLQATLISGCVLAITALTVLNSSNILDLSPDVLELSNQERDYHHLADVRCAQLTTRGYVRIEDISGREFIYACIEENKIKREIVFLAPERSKTQTTDYQK